MNDTHRLHPCPYSYDHYVPVDDKMEDSRRLMDNAPIVLKNYGPQPFVVNINEATKQNNNYRTGLWTGSNLQVTLMSIKVGDDIGLEVHPKIDQFIRIEDIHWSRWKKTGSSSNFYDLRNSFIFTIV